MSTTTPATPVPVHGGAAGATRTTRGRSCGECSLCCKLPSVAELGKPEARWCTHCKPGKGCTIYQERPNACREFACLWLLDPGVEDIWYPRRSKMVLHAVENEFGIPPVLMKVLVDRDFPTAWRQEPYYSKIKQMALFGLQNQAYHVRVITCGTTKEVLILPDRDIEDPGPGAVKRVGENAWQFLPADSNQAAAAMTKGRQ